MGGHRKTGNVGGPTFRSLGGEQAAETAVKLLPCVEGNQRGRCPGAREEVSPEGGRAPGPY